MSTTSDTPTGWTSPDNVYKFIKQVGLPWTFFAALLIFVLTVFTGIWKVPLFDALDVIVDVHADQEGVKEIMSESLKVQISTCELIAKDKEEAKRCHPST
jgi:hypothetical protein